MKYQKNQPETIQKMFGSIAEDYDRTNGILSFQLHRLWNRQLISEITDEKNLVKGSDDLPDNLPNSLLDLCSGTGEIAFSYLKKSKRQKKVYLLDFCEEMLNCARKKSERAHFSSHDISFLKADAEEIPLQKETVEAVTVAYGIRNVNDTGKCLSEVFRVLKPGGSFAILELTEPKNFILKSFHKLYLKILIPTLGKFLTSDKEAYDYLNKSIRSFIKPEKLESMMRETGFIETLNKPLLGGIATIISGKKP